jgi:hypothetical protein
VSPEQVVGYLAYSLGLLPSPSAMPAPDVVPLFDEQKVGREDWILPADVVQRIAAA